MAFRSKIWLWLNWVSLAQYLSRDSIQGKVMSDKVVFSSKSSAGGEEGCTHMNAWVC